MIVIVSRALLLTLATCLHYETSVVSENTRCMAGTKMKLELSRVVQGRGRLGVLKGLGRTGQHSLDVPGCLLYTHFGTVPHLTQETLHTMNNLPSVTQVTLSNM